MIDVDEIYWCGKCSIGLVFQAPFTSKHFGNELTRKTPVATSEFNQRGNWNANHLTRDYS